MSDITMCKGQGCPVKESCNRFTAPAEPIYQSYFVDIPGKYEMHENTNTEQEQFKAVWNCDMYWGDRQDSIMDVLNKAVRL